MTFSHTSHVQELNVRELSLATEDSQYGVRLQGEPDNERLGKRLKGDFKKVHDWLSQLANVVEKIISCISTPCPPPPSLSLFPPFLPLSYPLLYWRVEGRKLYEAYLAFPCQEINLTLHVRWLLCLCYRWLLQ